jgi:prophage regulatory protein
MSASSAVVSAVPASSVKEHLGPLGQGKTHVTQAQNAARAEAIRALPPGAPRILRRPEVEALVGMRKTALYERIQAGEFPRPVPIGRRAVGWLSQEVMGWIEARAALRA